MKSKIIWSIGHQLKIPNIIKATNCELVDSNGNKYKDLESGVWCTSVGHGNPRVKQTMLEQINKITHTGFVYSNPIIETSASKVLKITGLNGGKCEFLCSGSEAVEFCVRGAKTITDNAKVFTFADSYFGAYGDAAQKEHPDWVRYNWQDCGCSLNESGCQANCEEFLKIPFSEIKTFLFEPGSSSGLVYFPSQNLIQAISNKIKEQNGFIIINEVTTGVGRTGKWFGYQHYKLKPDMVAVGKGIGNGYPVSIAVVSKRVAKLLKQKSFLYSQSHQNDPLGAAVVSEVINEIENENLIVRSNKLGKKIQLKLNRLKQKFPIIKEVRGRGLMIAIEFYKEAAFFQNELLKRGFIVTKRSNKEVLRLDPALTIHENDVNLLFKELNFILIKYNT